MQTILKNFEHIKQLKQSKQIDGKQVDCQIYANKSILIGDLSKKNFEGYYEFVYRSKFYIQGHIQHNNFNQLTILWRDDLYFRGILNFTQDQFDGEIVYKDIISIKIKPNQKIGDLDENSIQYLLDDLKDFEIEEKKNKEKSIYKLIYKEQCLVKIKQKKSLHFTFYQYSEIFGKKSSINFSKPFAFKKKLYKNEKKIKEKIINFYSGQAKTKDSMNPKNTFIKSLLTMKGFKINFDKQSHVQGYSLPLFKDCIYFGLTVNTHYNKKEQQIEDINIEYHNKQSSKNSQQPVQLKNYKELKFLSQIDIQNFQQEKLIFDDILNQLCDKYNIIEQVIEDLFQPKKLKKQITHVKDISSSNIIICSDNEICNDQITNKKIQEDKESQNVQDMIKDEINENNNISKLDNEQIIIETNGKVIDQNNNLIMQEMIDDKNKEQINENQKSQVQSIQKNIQEQKDENISKNQDKKFNFIKNEIIMSQTDQNNGKKKSSDNQKKISREDQNINLESFISSFDNISNFEIFDKLQLSYKIGDKNVKNIKQKQQQKKSFKKIQQKKQKVSLIKENNYSYSFKLKFQRGTFKNNKLTGNCIEIFDKYYYNGIYSNGKRNGLGYLVEQDVKKQGDYFQYGNFKENKKNGQFLIQKNGAIHKVIIEDDKFYQVPKKEKYLGVFRKFYNHKNKDDILIEGKDFEFYGKFDKKTDKFYQQSQCILKILNQSLSQECQCQLLEQKNDIERDQFYKIDLINNKLIVYSKQIDQIKLIFCFFKESINTF